MSRPVWTLAIVALCVAIALVPLVLKGCLDDAQRHGTEVTPVLEATTPEGTGPAESEEETVVELPDTSGIKLAGGR